jgi:hypothetical protein
MPIEGGHRPGGDRHDQRAIRRHQRSYRGQQSDRLVDMLDHFGTERVGGKAAEPRRNVGRQSQEIDPIEHAPVRALRAIAKPSSEPSNPASGASGRNAATLLRKLPSPQPMSRTLIGVGAAGNASVRQISF